MKAVWKSRVIAESDFTVEIEGDVYFPVNDVDMSYLKLSDHQTFCEVKGEANWFHITDGDFLTEDGAWVYPEPPEGQENVRNLIGFSPAISISK